MRDQLKTVKSELNFDPVDTTDVQKFDNKFCSLELLKEALE